MRVIAGTARSMPLKTPAGKETRPTTDRIKETLFNMLAPYLSGCTFLDLFSGSGQIGIEALSRGAEKAVFVERDKDAIGCVNENLRFTKFQERAIVVRQDVLVYLGSLSKVEAGVIFMDPPYGLEIEKQVLTALSGKKFKNDTLIVVEAEKQTDLSYAESLGFTLVKEKYYKTNKHVFLRKGE